ncbi:MAG: acetyl-CoA decarbonylase/synthase complex subunit delta [Candidatus Solincola sediminis]|nr:MAG: acetyl-CoA decarbonylase/synthase complex subunit delta [Candidatus Solincola sediminis]
MAFNLPTETAKGKVREVELGAGGKAKKEGGENCLPFHLWEGQMPNRPMVAAEVSDEVGEFPAALEKALGDVKNDPVAWAKKAVGEWGADAVFLLLTSTDPKATDAPPEQAADTVIKVEEAIDVPLIVYGTEDLEKDAELMKVVATKAEGKNLVMGPAKEENFKRIGAPAIGYKQTVVGMTPIDVNLAKQLNILLTNLGMEADKLIIDPTTGALGYGLEYTYSVMERLKIAALMQNDSMTQMPLLGNVGFQAWKTKEAKSSQEEYPEWGDPEKRGIMWETITALALLLAGADILVLRHPESIRLTKKLIDDLCAVGV